MKGTSNPASASVVVDGYTFPLPDTCHPSIEGLSSKLSARVTESSSPLVRIWITLYSSPS